MTESTNRVSGGEGDDLGPPDLLIEPASGSRGSAQASQGRTTSRRSVLRGGLMAGAGALVGGLAGGFVGHSFGESQATTEPVEPFGGVHQSGVVTNTQRQAVLATFDITSSDRGDLVALLKAWTQLGSELVTGASVAVPIYANAAESNANAYADTTGGSTTDDSFEAYGLGPSRLTLTVGFGRSLFTSTDGKGRFGIGDQLPGALIDLPHFAGDEIVAADSDGDLFLQACADDPQVAFHAVRSIARIAPDVATLRWTQLGFSPSNEGGTPRNLMGFKDGTMNSNVHPPVDLETTVWAGPEGPAWMHGGSYLVYRRIRITLEHWDRLAASLQEQVIGRTKLDGAPLGAPDEFSPLDLDAHDSQGYLVIPATAHVRLAAPQTNDGAVILRRAFSYNNGTTPFVERWPPWRQALEYDAGLLFLAYQKDPRTSFVPIFAKLAETDALNEFTTHTASAVFAVPPGVNGGDGWIGQPLFS
jgi:deferrochelatase/peroxidase EfeB